MPKYYCSFKETRFYSVVVEAPSQAAARKFVGIIEPSKCSWNNTSFDIDTPIGRDDLALDMGFDLQDKPDFKCDENGKEI